MDLKTVSMDSSSSASETADWARERGPRVLGRRERREERRKGPSSWESPSSVAIHGSFGWRIQRRGETEGEDLRAGTENFFF